MYKYQLGRYTENMYLDRYITRQKQIDQIRQLTNNRQSIEGGSPDLVVMGAILD